MSLLKRLRFMPLLAVLFAAGCGGGGGSAFDFGDRGVGFSTENPNIVLAGRTVELLVYGRSVVSADEGNDVTIEASTTVGTLNETQWTQRLGNSGTIRYHALRLTIPQGTPEGTAIGVRVFRTVERVAGSPQVDEETWNMTVGTATIQGTLVAPSLSGARGTSVTTQLNLLPTGNASGSVRLVGLVDGTTVSPQSVRLTEGQTTPRSVSVSYAIPADAEIGSVIEVPVAWQATAGHGTATLRVTVALPATVGDFTIGLNPTAVSVNSGGATVPITVTITPLDGFVGPVQITVTHPSPSISVTPPTTNPFTVNVTGNEPVTATFRLSWDSTQGFPQGPATVTATSGAVQHTANLNITAS